MHVALKNIMSIKRAQPSSHTIVLSLPVQLTIVMICRRLSNNGSVVAKMATLMMTKEFTKRSVGYFSSTMKTKPFDVLREKEEFIKALPRLIEDMAKHPKFEEIPAAREWMRKVLNDTVTGGKYTRGLTTVLSYKTVAKPETITEETVRLAQALGWCIEFFQAYCVVLDDIADGSLMRRGQPCWYRREDVGLPNAIYDSCLIYACMHHILKDKFEKSPVYVNLFQAFNENIFYVSTGQFLDIRGSKIKNKYDVFTKEYYDAIVKYKCSYYTYQLPISNGLLLANCLDEASHKNCDQISFQLGSLLQMKDDYVDCFGDETLTGKTGTDIQGGKCTWLAVNALTRCNAKDRIVFLASYGSKEAAHIERIKQLYIQLQLPQVFEQEERDRYNDLLERIETLPSVEERELYRQVLDIYDLQ